MSLLDEVLARMREACLDLPEATETLTFHHPTFQANKKTFAVLDRYQGVDCVCFKATPERQAELLEDERYFASPFGARHGWTCVKVEPEMDWDEVEELLVESWRLHANRRMLIAFEGGDEGDERRNSD